MTRTKQESARRLSKRTQVVWATFFVTIASAMFVLQLGAGGIQKGKVLTKIASIEDRPKLDPIFSWPDNVVVGDWSSIVIHELGQRGGTAERIDRYHRNKGLNGLGHHFLIGNGNGISDGNVHIGYRWLNQSPCAVFGATDPALWDGVISICLVGDGRREKYTKQQGVHNLHLVQRLRDGLYKKYGIIIPRERVRRANEIDEEAPNSEYFKLVTGAQFESQLLDIPASN
ncbi:MAG TPA: hypothetical protein EYM64_04620 [Phycisphaerales bacterium]|nr:hypothetical protein [Phycisphaerales bacterium]